MSSHLLATILTLATLVATTLSALAFGTLKAVRDANKDLRDRNSDLELSNTELRGQLKEEKEKNRVLSELVTGEETLERIEGLVESQSELLSEHHTESIHVWTSMVNAINELGGKR